MSLKNSNKKQIKSLWMKIRGQTNTENLVTSVYHRLPDQWEDADEAFILQEQALPHSQALIILREFQVPWHLET